MEYQKTNVESFIGLDANLRPEVIKDQQASDIENLRFDKLGYLTNRNGTAAYPMDMSRTVYFDISAKLAPIGTVGVTEYVLEEPFGVGSGQPAVVPYDDATLSLINANASNSDRFMVYAVRLPANSANLSYVTDPYNQQNRPSDPANQYTWRYKMAYVLSPITGHANWRDKFFFAPNASFGPMGRAFVSGDPDNDLPSLYATIGTRSVTRADDKVIRTQIYAPTRWLGMHNTYSVNGVPKDGNWIDHYVTMVQYRGAIVISDKTNGDMLLVDEYNEAEFSETKKHRFSLRDNALAPFDVDDVVVDFGLDMEGFNNGVKAPMALYKFYLNRRRLESTKDNFQAYFTRGDESPTLSQTYLENLSNDDSDVIRSVWKPVTSGSTFILTEFWYDLDDEVLTQDASLASGITINNRSRYTFTMSKEGEEYDDLFGPLTLSNPDVDEEGQVSSDVYKWEDFEINYFPASGLTQGAGNFLTDSDRTWDKTSSGNTKLIPLKTKKGVEQNVPLGIWRYRFVWYLGGGEYSAPSAELVLPDILFSGIKDSDIVAATGSYSRPIGLSSVEDIVKSPLQLDVAPADALLNELPVMQAIRIFDGNNITAYGQNFLRVKEQLFYPEHTFAAEYASTAGASWPTNWGTESFLAKSQVSVVCTTMWTDANATLQGTAVESADSAVTDSDETMSDFDEFKITSYRASRIPIRVPLFSTFDGDSYQYNTVFTKYGVIRTAYQNVAKYSTVPGYNVATPAYQIVFAGRNRFAVENTDEYQYVDNGVARSGQSVYLNIVPFQVPQEENNRDDDQVYSGRPRHEYRNPTQVRGVRSESDRLTWLKDNLPTEVVSRMVISGIGEIPLVDYGDEGTWISQILTGVNDADTLEYIQPRTFTDASTYVIASNVISYGSNWTSYTDFFVMDGLTAINKTVKFSNLRIRISAPGERLTIPEQLSMYIPASLLFGAPHVKLKIPVDRIPRRARQLLVFRTRASHDNAWQPNEYGLVKAIDIKRDPSTGEPDYPGLFKYLEFLDDVDSGDLDFSYNLEDYNGFIQPIKSRFCLPLNERVFYSNIIEAYKPQAPRNSVDITPYAGAGADLRQHKNLNFGSNTELQRLWTYRLIEGALDTTNIANTSRYLYYFLSYTDDINSLSLTAYSGALDRGDLATPANRKKRPIMYCLPSGYDGAVRQANVYRLQSATPITEVRFNASRSVALTPGKVYLVAQGVVEYQGNIYYPKDIIQTVAESDTGVPASYAAAGVNFFGGANTNRGEMQSYCDPILLEITTVFDGAAGPNYIDKIGTIVPEDEGIFYDDDLPSLGRLPLKQLAQNQDVLESGLRWSEPYTPNKIKLASLMEVRAGDGDQITGMAQLYGNLVIAKERSLHRLAVQGSNVPVSRVDEISNNIGCIAPNTFTVINNTLYFLSWAGFFRYNNNVLEKVDGAFAEELQIRLRSAQNGVSNPAIRDASCGWNPTYREIYLNIPVMSSASNEGDFSEANQNGVLLVDNVGERQVRGITYAINIDTGLATKYRYMDDASYFTDPSGLVDVGFAIAPEQRAPRVQGRLYYTNTLGQLRSAEILPTRTYNYLTAKPTAGNASTQYLKSLFFIESPTKAPNGTLDKATDDFLLYTVGGAQNIQFRNVRVFWRSKAWTAGDKTVLKRVRKVYSHVSMSNEPVVIRGIVHTSPGGPTATSNISWSYTFADDRFVPPPYPSALGELSAIPTEAAGASTAPSQNRGERHIFEVEGGGSFQMEYFGFYWRPINVYER